MTHFFLEYLVTRHFPTLLLSSPSPSVESKNVTFSKLEITLAIYPDSTREAAPGVWAVVMCISLTAVFQQHQFPWDKTSNSSKKIRY